MIRNQFSPMMPRSTTIFRLYQPQVTRPEPKQNRTRESWLEISGSLAEQQDSLSQTLPENESNEIKNSGKFREIQRRISLQETMEQKKPRSKDKADRRVTISEAPPTTVPDKRDLNTSQQLPKFLMQRNLWARILDVKEKQSPTSSQPIRIEQREALVGKQQTVNRNLSKSYALGDTGKQKTTEDHGASLGNTTESCSPLSQNHLQTQPIRSGLWCEQDHVIKSGIVETMTGPEKMLQEALFEVITSEESYMRSLEILIGHFKVSLECKVKDDILAAQTASFSRLSKKDLTCQNGVLKKYETEMLFCNIEVLRNLSGQFLSKFDSLQNDQKLVNNYLDLLTDHVNLSLRKSVVKYCSNINHQREMFQHLMDNNAEFAEKISELENKKVTIRSFSSFLITPMTRVCHMPLLIEKIAKCAEKLTSDYAVDIAKSARKTLEIVQDVAAQCNQETRKLEDYAEKQKVLLAIEKSLVIPLDIQLNLITASRSLLCECNAVQVVPSNNIFKNNIEVKLHFKLFHDILLICRPNNDMFEVLDVADVTAGSVFLSELNEDNQEHFLSRAKFLSPSQIQKRPISLVFFRTKVGGAPEVKRSKTSFSGFLAPLNEPKAATSQCFQDHENVFIIQSEEKRNDFVCKLQTCLTDTRDLVETKRHRKLSSGRRRSSLKPPDVQKVLQTSTSESANKVKLERSSTFDAATLYFSFSSSTEFYADTGVLPFSRNSAFSPLYFNQFNHLGSVKF